jgi:hypothetical protein
MVEIKEQLAKILDVNNISDDLKTLEAYSKARKVFGTR